MDLLHKVTIFFGSVFDPKGAQQAERSIDNVVNKSQSLSGIYKTTQQDSLKVTQSISGISGEVKKGNHIWDEYGLALRRAFIVAPVWMAARTILMEVNRTLSDGVKYWEDFERAMFKASAVIASTSENLDELSTDLRDKILKFSEQTGISIDKLAGSFYRFGTLGIEYRDAWGGAVASNKLAMATMGDADTIARAFAMTLKLLGGTMNQTLSPEQKMEDFAGKIYLLWKKNAFEANEFAASLQNFIGTAKVANFTADETAAYLAAIGTSGIIGARGGNLFRTAMFKLVENLDELVPLLGIQNNELERTPQLLLRVIARINELSKAGKLSSESMKAMQGIFGGVRGAQVISGLNAVLPVLRQNFADIGIKGSESIDLINQKSQEYVNSLHGQIEKLRTLRKEVGMVYVQGVLGGEDYIQTLQRINNALIALMPTIKELGKALPFALGALAGGLAAPGLAPLVGLIAAIGYATTSLQEKQVVNLKTEANFYNQISDGLRGKLTLEEYSSLIQEATNKVRDKELKITSEIIDQLKTAEGRKRNELKVQQEITDSQEKQKEEQAKILAAALEADKINKKLLSEHEVALLKMRGATEREILDVKIKQYENGDLLISKEERVSKIKELELQREVLITQEQEKRLNLKSEEVKIYEIAQKYGTAVAEDIAKAVKLQGKAIDDLSGISLDVFKKEFGNLFENFKAQDFFRNEPQLKRWLESYGTMQNNTPNIPSGTGIKGEILVPKLDNRIHLTIKVEE